MSGQRHVAAAVIQRRFLQQMTRKHFGQSSMISDDIDGEQLRYCQQQWLDDPVIDVIKRHLNIGSRIGLEPVSHKFARIAFFIKRRMAIVITSVTPTPMDGLCLTLTVATVSKNAFVDGLRFVILLDEVNIALRSLFRHVLKWHTIRFMRPHDTTGILERIWNEIGSQLLDIIFEESSEVVDIRQLFCDLSTADAMKIADVVRSSALNLHSLALRSTLEVASYGIDEQLPTLCFLASAICDCHKLTDLELNFDQRELFPLDRLSKILALPQLRTIILGYSPNKMTIPVENHIDIVYNHRQFPHLHSLSIDGNWLPAIGRLPDLSVFKNVQHLQLVTDSDLEPMLGVVWRIVAEMRWPAFVDLDAYNSDVTWANVFNDYLPMVYRTGADVERTVYLFYGLPTLTNEQFQEGLATLPPLVQLALTPPDLATVPVTDDGYQSLTFTFASGAKITFKMGLPCGG